MLYNKINISFTYNVVHVFKKQEWKGVLSDVGLERNSKAVLYAKPQAMMSAGQTRE
jgi:hypothetical protein